MALKAIERLDRQAGSRKAVAAEVRRPFSLAGAQYRAGAADLLTVLDTQRTLYDAEDVLSQLRLARLQARVALFKALGGGWQARADDLHLIGCSRSVGQKADRLASHRKTVRR